MKRAFEDTVSLLAGAGVGMALMYLLDPDKGAKRRQSIVRSARHTADNARYTLGSAGEALRSASEGLVRRTGESTASRWRDWSGSASGQASRASHAVRDYAGSIGSYLTGSARSARNMLPERWQSRRRREWSGGSTAGYAAGSLGLLALGVGIAYLFDPQQGRARRAYLRDKAISFSNDTSTFMRKSGRHLSNKLQGTIAEGRSMLRRSEVSDRQLCERIRAELGHHTTDAGGIDLNANNGHVTLRGSVAGDAIGTIVGVVGKIRGVRSIDCQLTPGDQQNQPQQSAPSSERVNVM